MQDWRACSDLRMQWQRVLSTAGLCSGETVVRSFKHNLIGDESFPVWGAVGLKQSTGRGLSILCQTRMRALRELLLTHCHSLYLPRTLRSICIVKFPIYAKIFSYWGILTMKAWSLLASIFREKPNQWASSWRNFLNTIWAVLVQVVNAFNLPRKASDKKLSSTCILPWQARSQWSQFPRVHWVFSLCSFGPLPG